jgi:hypothetical protein
MKHIFKKTGIYSRNAERGAAMMISVIFFIAASVLVVLGLTGPSAREFHTANQAFASHASYFMAESAGEDLYYRYKNMLPSSGSTLSIGAATAVATIDFYDSTTEEIVSTGNVQNSQHRATIRVGNGTLGDFSIRSWAQTR